MRDGSNLGDNGVLLVAQPGQPTTLQSVTAVEPAAICHVWAERDGEEVAALAPAAHGGAVLDGERFAAPQRAPFELLERTLARAALRRAWRLHPAPGHLV